MESREKYILYGLIILASIIYLFAIEAVHTSQFEFQLGGRDQRFSPFDIVLTSVGLVGTMLSAISFSAYRRKKDKKLFIIALAFLFFTLKSIFNIVDNFFIGGYQYIGIVAQTLELMMILAFFLVLFKR